jgi:site-specific DNA-methyltransferase (adenine-specific)
MENNSSRAYMPQAKRDDYETPRALFDELNKEFGFTIDAAASASNAKLPRYWTKAEDALAQEWGGGARLLQPAIWARPY